MDKRVINICDVCEKIFAGGDAPKDRFSETKTDDFSIPIYSNGEANSGLYGYTNFSRVNVPSITVSARGTIGYTTIRHEPFVPIVRLITLVPKTDVIDINYLYYATQNYKFVNNGTSIPQLTVPMLKRYSFPLPSMEQQKKIADEFDKVTVLINNRKRQLSKLDELVKSRFIEMFGDPIYNPMNWSTSLLKNVTSKIGSGATPKGGKECYQTEGITLIRSMNVYDGRFEYKGLAYITEEQAKQLDNVIIEENDVFINITGASIARSCVVPKHILPARVNQHVAIIRCITSVLNPIFANNMFLNRSFKRKLLDIGETGGATRQAITKQQLESLTVVLPPIELQNQFAAFVEQTDKSKFEIKQSLEKLEVLKKALMQKYFG